MAAAEIRLQFVRAAGFSSNVIAWFSHGHFSHVEGCFETVVPGVYELPGSYERAVTAGGVTYPAGVQVRPWGYNPHLVRQVHFVIPCTAKQKALWREFLLSQVNQPYDWDAIWGFAFNRDWRDHHAWICSELQAAALEAAGIVPRLYLAANKITPVALALAVSALRGVREEVLIG